MSLVIFLDSGPLSLATNPKGSVEARACAQWLLSCLTQGARVCIPEICDYEVRRELVRAAKKNGLERLNLLRQSIEYIPLTTAMMNKAAELWAAARNAGRPTAAKEALDADVILVAQATLSAQASEELVIATTNIGHLAQFITAKHWRDIKAA